MIKNIRNFANSTAAKILLGLLVLTFIFLWGIGDVVNKIFNKYYLVKIGSCELGERPFAINMRLTSLNVQKEDVAKELEEKRALNETFERLVLTGTLELFRKANGLYFSPRGALSNYIACNPRFLDEDRRFKISLFNSFLKQLQITENEFAQYVITPELTLTVLTYIFSGFQANEIITKNFLNAILERFHFKYTEIAPEKFTVSNSFTDEEVNQFYQENQHLFFVPEMRTISYLIINKDEVRCTVPEAKIREEYKNRINDGILTKEDDYQQASEIIKLELQEDIRYTYLETAFNELQNAINTKSSLSELANKYPFMSYRTVTCSKNNTDMNGNKVIATPYTDKLLLCAFDLKIGAPAELIDYSSNIEIAIQVSEIHQSFTRDLESVKDIVKSYIRNARQITAAELHAASLVEKINAGNLKFSEDPNFKTISFIRNNINNLPANFSRELFVEAFALKPHKSVFLKVGNNFTVIALDKKVKPSSDAVEEKLKDSTKDLSRLMIEDLNNMLINNIKQTNKVDINYNAIKARNYE